MPIKSKETFASDAGLTLIQTDATVAVAGNLLTSTIITAGATWNGAYSNATQAIAANDRFYYSYKKSVKTNPLAYFMTKRAVGCVPEGNFTAVNTNSSILQRATIWEGNFGSPVAMAIDTFYYGCYVYRANDIDVYYNSTGHSDSLLDYTLMGSLNGGDEVGENERFSLGHVGNTSGEVVIVGPYAFTDSSGLSSPIPTGLTVTVDSDTVITLDFTDAGTSTNETSIAIERSLSSGAGFSQIATVAQGTETYENTGLTPGRTYYYRLRSFETFSGSNFYSSYTSVQSGTTTGGSTEDFGEEMLALEEL